MKKLFISALLALAISSGAYAAEGNNVHWSVKNNFVSQFKDASNVEWSDGKGYSKATFTVDNERMEAFYSSDGELIGTSRTANLGKLPLSAKRAFTKKLEGYTVKEAIRFEGSEESAYFISASNHNGSVVFKITDQGAVTIKKM